MVEPASRGPFRFGNGPRAEASSRLILVVENGLTQLIRRFTLRDAGGDGEVARHVDHRAAHVEDAIDAEDDADRRSGDSDRLHHNHDQRK